MQAIITKWLGPHKDVQYLQGVTLLRSTAQGIALVDMSLLLKDAGFSAGAIGMMLATTGAVRTILMLFAGELNALLGAKRYLLLYEIITCVAAVVIALSSSTLAIAAAMIGAGLGIGHSGSGGPTAPIERRWLAAYARRQPTKLYAIHALLGYFGLGAGALLACLLSLWSHALPGTDSYRPAFALLALLTGGVIFAITRIAGGQRKDTSQTEETTHAPNLVTEGFKSAGMIAGCACVIVTSLLLQKMGLHLASLYVPIAVFILWIASQVVKNLAGQKQERIEGVPSEEIKQLANLLGGITTTLTCTMTSYWFSAKFHASPGWIGVMMGVSYITAGLLSLLQFGESDKRGSIQTVIAFQSAAIVFILILPWVTTFWLAASLEICCTACNLGTRGSRTAVIMEDRRSGRRSWSAKINMLLVRIGAVLWPGAFGKFVEEGLYVPPFTIAAALQSGAVALYAYVHKRPRLLKKEQQGTQDMGRY